MGKHTNYSQRESSKSKSRELPAVWRSVGCLMILIVPALSIFAAKATITYAISKGWIERFTGNITLPAFFYKSNGLIFILGPILRTPNFNAIAAASLMYIILIGGVVALIYAIGYRMFGPDPYGPTDEPPSKVKVKKTSR